jgi:hypothetical protein
MTVAERYLELGLRLGRHEPELVDSYYGPAELRQRIEDEPLTEPARLAADAAELLAKVDDRWLASQVRALETTARTLAGEELPYAEEVELTYGIRPRWIDEREFERTQAELDEALAGPGDLAARYARWFEEAAVPPAAVERAVDAAMQLVRERTHEAIGLPEGEEIELEIVTGERWFGYAHYLGGFRTRISVNTDLSFPASDLLRFAAHEGYPGHHTHRAWQEADLARDEGRIDATLDLLWSPDAVVSEGLAETGPDFVLDGDAHGELAERLRPLGFEYDAEVGARVAEARRKLYYVPSNVTILLHERGASRQEAWDYAAHWSLQPADRVDKILENAEERRSRGYVHSYSEGRRLCSAFVDGDPARLRRLMTARLLPAELDAATASER